MPVLLIRYTDEIIEEKVVLSPQDFLYRIMAQLQFQGALHLN